MQERMEVLTASDRAPHQDQKVIITSWKKILLGGLLAVSVFFVVWDSATHQVVSAHIKACLFQIQKHPLAGVVIYSGLCFAATIFFVPGSILTLGGGAAFGSSLGIAVGTVVAGSAVFVGASFGAIVSFLIGRYLFRDWAASWIEKYPFIQAIDQALGVKGLRILMLLRLSPSIPFNALNYALGVTGVSFSTYCYTLFGMIPGTIMYVMLGATAGSMFFTGDENSSGDGNDEEDVVSQHQGLKLALLIAGIALDVCAVVFIAQYAKEELDKISSQRETIGDEETALGGSNYLSPTEYNKRSQDEGDAIVTEVFPPWTTVSSLRELQNKLVVEQT